MSDEAVTTPMEVCELCVNLDDVSPEVVAAAAEALLAAGALDVWMQAIQMKKQRPGVMLSVLCALPRRDEFAAMLLRETGSFGVRHRTWGRLVLDRRHEQVSTRYGAVRIKVGSRDGRAIVATPEFEDVRQLAARVNQPVRLVMQAAHAAANDWLSQVKQP